MDKYQTIVIGLGAMGSATVYQLARRGVKTLGIDRYSPPHQRGSTHGDTRIFRQAIGEGDGYTPIAQRSFEIWRELEELSNVELLTVTGGLVLGESISGGSLHGKSDFLKRTIDSANRYAIAHEILDAREIKRRFPQFNVPTDSCAYYEHLAGYLAPERCVKVQLSLAKESGADIRINEKVVSFVPEDDGVRVETENGVYFAEMLIASAGPWLSELIGHNLANKLNVYRQVQYWFEVDNPAQFEVGRCPVFIWDFGTGAGMYGFPTVAKYSNGIKVATEQYAASTTPEDVNRIVTDDEKAGMYNTTIKGRLLNVKNRCLHAETCLYTVTPDSDFIVDRLPNFPQIIVASPCSGHGFKHSAAIGEILAELAIYGKSKLDISGFGLGRF
jgi:sarcosine oxidase